MTAEFRPLKTSDLCAMLAIYNHYVRTSTATFHTEEIDENTLAALLLPGYPRFGSWVIEFEGRGLGYVVLGRYKPREAYDGCAEVTIYLDPSIAGKGLGSQALDFLDAVARERAFHSLLSIVCAENAASVALFTKHGYRQCAHYHEVGRKFDRWLDVLSFEKLLPATP